ncbi:MAG: deoxyribose-phosphate aldolase [bacterium]
MNALEIARTIDHTNLKPDTTIAEIELLCAEALEYKFASVCVLPYYVNLCKKVLEETDMRITTVAGFPLGAFALGTKARSAESSISAGADEIDMVINIAALKNRDFSLVEADIAEVVRVCKSAGKTSKVIIETCLLTEGEKAAMTKIVGNSGADFIKTSTGFSKSGATVSDILLINSIKSEHLKIKASAGIRTAKFTLELIKAGAERIGTSSSVDIMNELDKQKQT